MKKNKIPTVIVYSDYVHSACSYWRSHGVLSYLSRDNEINFINGTWDDTWTTLQFADIAFFQRPMMKECLNQMAMAKDLGLKIIIDLDDYNHIPETHLVYNEYMRGYDETEFMKIMMLADLVITTNEYLKVHYSMYHSNIHIVPNSLNDYYLKPSNFNQKSKKVIIRGGSHHEHDIYHYKDAIIDFFVENDDYELILVGSDPVYLSEEVPNYKYAGDFDIHTYFAFIKQIKPVLFIVPLVDNKFNKGKSNISWIEATYAGAVALVPESLGVSDEMCITYNSVSKMSDKLKDIDLLLTKELHENSLKELKSNYTLSKNNNLRLNLINGLL